MNTDIKQRIAECFDAMDRKPLSISQMGNLLRDCLKHIEELDQQLQSQLREREADCAAKREALLKIGNQFREDDDIVPVYSLCKQATSSDAGKALLERMQAVEKERDRYKSALVSVRTQSGISTLQWKIADHALQPPQKEQ